jgi:tRNA A-37 threonylcarbamoyl transferase component Bud32
VNAISLEDYQTIVDRSVILERDKHGLKVLETSDGYIVKLFRRKRFFSSALFNSYSSRFVANAKALKKLGFHTVDVVEVSYCKPIKRTLVMYRPIPGETLRSALRDQSSSEEIMEKFIVLLAALHDKGVLFRSIHLNNVIISDDSNKLGLIDFADMKIYSKGLSRAMRLRNFKHLTRYKADQESIKNFGVDRFIDLYFSSSSLPESYKSEFLNELQKALETEGRV